MSHCHVSYRRVTLVCATPGVVFSAGAESPVSGNLHEVPVCWFESGVVLAQNSQLVPLCLEDHPHESWRSRVVVIISSQSPKIRRGLSEFTEKNQDNNRT